MTIYTEAYVEAAYVPSSVSSSVASPDETQGYSLCTSDVATVLGLGSARRLNKLCQEAGVLSQEPRYGLWWAVDPEDPRFVLRRAMVPGKGPCAQTRWTREGVEWARLELAKITREEALQNLQRWRAQLWQADHRQGSPRVSQRAMDLEGLLRSWQDTRQAAGPLRASQ